MPERVVSPEFVDMLPDPRQVRAGFARRAARHDRDPFFQNEVRQRMLERLELVRLQPETVLDLGCGPGRGAAALARRYPRARVLALDNAWPMLQQVRRHRPWWRRVRAVAGDAAALPVADASVDLVFSSLMLQWCDPQAVFAECRRVLRKDGLLMFSTLGPDTLMELRRAWRQVDAREHVNPFMDMHDLGDALIHAGFADPVMDVETLTLTWASADDLLRDVRVAGAGNVNPGRPLGLTGRGRFRRLCEALEKERCDGVLPLTVELVNGHAWAPAAPRSRNVAPGEVHVPLSQLGRRQTGPGPRGEMS